MGNRGRLWAMDIDASRLASGAPRCAKAGVDNVQRHVIEQVTGDIQRYDTDTILVERRA
tara:strand:+ start:264 stop:440 length:177 start_codon:yes stop_codon:yes gene_type:complete